MNPMRLENLNDDNIAIWIENIAMWGAKGLRIMIENFINSLEDDTLINDIHIAINDMHIKAQDIERSLYRISDKIVKGGNGNATQTGEIT